MRILSILFFFASLNAFGATCTTTTRTNYTTGQTLTSTALNADFNQLVTKANAFDGGCVTDGTLEASALNSTDFAAVTNGIHQGCALAYSDANTISVGKCILGVNGNFVKTTEANTVTWGCTGCDAEASSSLYYVYAKTGSSGTTLNLLISSTAPGVDGYDLSSNKVLGRFYNGSSGAIDQYSVFSWITNGFGAVDGKVSNSGVAAPVDSFSFSFGDTNATTVCASNPCTYLDQIGNNVSSVALTAAGTYTITFRKSYAKSKCTGVANSGSSPIVVTPANGVATSNVSVFMTSSNTPGAASAYATMHCEGY